jgi:hypothetical protein
VQRSKEGGQRVGRESRSPERRKEGGEDAGEEVGRRRGRRGRDVHLRGE